MKRFAFVYLLALLSTVIADDFHRERVAATPRQYLSGQDPDDAVIWQFRIDKGRQAGRNGRIKVPSCWEVEGFGTYTYGNMKDDAVATYSRTFQLDRTQSGGRVLLFFEGVTSQADVRINGQSAGATHHGGFYRFSYDITDKVQFDRDNTIEVVVRKVSTQKAVTAAEVGDFWHFGGIIRPVYLKYVPQSHIAWVGVDGDMNGNLAVVAELVNAKAGDILRCEVKDSGGRAIGVPLECSLEKDQVTASLKGSFDNIKLWSDEYPHLYRCHLQLTRGGTIVDREIDRFGFRTFEVRPGKGFFLNGRRVLLKGAARHCFWPETGRSVPNRVNREDVELMKFTLNMNFVRCVHYPPDETFLDVCDEIGLLASSELTGWSKPLPTQPGRKLVKEMVRKDHNHPSVIMWHNANHRGFNSALHDDFGKWDLQNRPIVWNDDQKSKEIPGIEKLGDHAVDTRFYPDYVTFKKRLEGKTHLVCPNETLHALYDGGGGAGLADYMGLLRQSPVGGGIVIWAYCDESVVRSDLDGRLDGAGNRAPDGIVGPYREIEASAMTARTEFCPVQIETDELPPDFSGAITVRNEFSHTNLREVVFRWELISFDSFAIPEGQTNINKSGSVHGADIEPGGRGRVRLPLPNNWNDSDALRLHAVDSQQKVRVTKTWPIQTMEQTIRDAFSQPGRVEVKDAEGLEISSDDVVFQFDRENGCLKQVTRLGKSLRAGRGPSLVGSRRAADSAFDFVENIDAIFLGKNNNDKAKTVWVDFTAKINGWEPQLDQSGEFPVVLVSNPADDSFLRWTILPGAIVRLAYRFNIPEGDYGYVGLAFDVEGVKEKTWLGMGPYRVWKNRLSGADYGLWNNEFNDSIPGQAWDLPCFKGNFKDVRWMRLDTDEGAVVIGTEDQGRCIGVLSPTNGHEAMNAIWSYPEEDRLYVFHCIAPVGSKWRGAADAGPAGRANKVSGPVDGTLYLKYVQYKHL